LSFCPAHGFPNNWKIDGDYPPAGGQCNSFLAEFTEKRRGAENAAEKIFTTDGHGFTRMGKGGTRYLTRIARIIAH
jgi:hypothetical protein